MEENTRLRTYPFQTIPLAYDRSEAIALVLLLDLQHQVGKAEGSSTATRCGTKEQWTDKVGNGRGGGTDLRCLGDRRMEIIWRQVGCGGVRKRKE